MPQFFGAVQARFLLGGKARSAQLAIKPNILPSEVTSSLMASSICVRSGSFVVVVLILILQNKMRQKHELESRSLRLGRTIKVFSSPLLSIGALAFRDEQPLKLGSGRDAVHFYFFSTSDTRRQVYTLYLLHCTSVYPPYLCLTLRRANNAICGPY